MSPNKWVNQRFYFFRCQLCSLPQPYPSGLCRAGFLSVRAPVLTQQAGGSDLGGLASRRPASLSSWTCGLSQFQSPGISKSSRLGTISWVG